MNLFLVWVLGSGSVAKKKRWKEEQSQRFLVILEAGSSDGFLGKPTPSKSNSMTSLISGGQRNQASTSNI